MFTQSKLLLQVPDLVETITKQVPDVNPTTIVGYSFAVALLLLFLLKEARENARLQKYQRKMDAKDLEFKQQFVQILTSVKMHLAQDSDLKDVVQELIMSSNHLSENVHETLAILRERYG
jgi:hypothetical protein